MKVWRECCNAFINFDFSVRYIIHCEFLNALHHFKKVQRHLYFTLHLRENEVSIIAIRFDVVKLLTI